MEWGKDRPSPAHTRFCVVCPVSLTSLIPVTLQAFSSHTDSPLRAHPPQGFPHSLYQMFSIGEILPLRGYLAMSADSLDCHNWEDGAPGISWVEARSVGKCLEVVQSLTMKNYPAQNASSAAAEKLALRGRETFPTPLLDVQTLLILQNSV